MQIYRFLNINKKISFIILLSLFSNLYIFSQNTGYDQLVEMEGEIQSLFEQLKGLTNESDLINKNNEIRLNIEETLALEASFDYPFDSLKSMFKGRSLDKKLRIFNWNIAFMDGSFKYYGYLQYYSKKKGEFLTYELYDNSKRTVNPEKQKLTNEDWYGALYFNIIQKKYKKNKYYFLFGWDGNNDYTNKKLIDVLYFDKNDKPVFGAPVFKMPKGKKHRVIFEYANHVSMTLMYDEKLRMIIFDLLAPQKPIYEGRYEFYGPEGTYDGLYFEKGKWHYQSVTDARNEKPRR